MSILARRRNKAPSNFQRAADGSMTLLEHLRELRTRLFRASIAIVLGMIVGYLLHTRILELLQGPYCDISLKNALSNNHGVLPPGYKCEFVALKVARLDLLRGTVRVAEAAPEVAGEIGRAHV